MKDQTQHEEKHTSNNRKTSYQHGNKWHQASCLSTI